MIRHAACHCGQRSIACHGEPLKVSLCHCLDCQRRTGSLFSVAAFFAREKVAVPADAWAAYTRDSAAGFPVTFHFCAACGSSVWWEPARMPLLIGVAVGALADPAFPAPEQAVWASARHGWLKLPADLPSHDENPVHSPAPG